MKQTQRIHTLAAAVREQQLSCRVRLGRQVSSLMTALQRSGDSYRWSELPVVFMNILMWLLRDIFWPTVFRRNRLIWWNRHIRSEILVQQQPSTFSCTPTENQRRVVHSKSVFRKRNIEKKGQSNLALGVSSSLIKYKASKPFCCNMTAEIPSSARLSAGLRCNDKAGYTEMEIAFCCF